MLEEGAFNVCHKVSSLFLVDPNKRENIKYNFPAVLAIKIVRVVEYETVSCLAEITQKLNAILKTS